MTENLFRQNVNVKDRKYLEADRVDEVLSFDDTSIVLSAGDFELIIGGSDLKIIALDREKKTIEVKGLIEAVVYGEKTHKKGLFSKIFR